MFAWLLKFIRFLSVSKLNANRSRKYIVHSFHWFMSLGSFSLAAIDLFPHICFSLSFPLAVGLAVAEAVDFVAFLFGEWEISISNSIFRSCDPFGALLPLLSWRASGLHVVLDINEWPTDKPASQGTAQEILYLRFRFASPLLTIFKSNDGKHERSE